MRSVAAALGLLLGIAVLTGCQEESPTGPTAEEFKNERAQLEAKLKKRKVVSGAAPTAVAEAGQDEQSAFAALSETYSYDAVGKRDPFRSYRWQDDVAVEDEGPRGPLEQFELGQLEVVAVVWETSRPRALISDPGGRSYVVREGSRMGKNEGRVIHIGDNLVLVKETYVDFAGEQTTKDVELRIRKSQGG